LGERVCGDCKGGDDQEEFEKDIHSDVGAKAA
jgi:hypothetical protein